jgi:pimeloyl-ACP methyl ester carboxylesterase
LLRNRGEGAQSNFSTLKTIRRYPPCDAFGRTTLTTNGASTASASIRHRFLSVGVPRVRLHVVECGSGEPVVLLHGFPEFSYSWRRQWEPLAAAGFRTLCPDLRGYGESDKPLGIAPYRTRRLVNDVAELIAQLGEGRAHVVGHDWGGVIAWRLAALYPHRVRKLAILNAPHPARFAQVLRQRPEQWLRSSYALFFQLPWLPEWALRRRNFALLEYAFRRQPQHSSAFSSADIAAYKRALAGPRGLAAPLNYYRAAFWHSHDLFEPPHTIAAATLLLWGERDSFLSSALTEHLEPWVPYLETVRLPTASHWLQNDAPAEVNGRLIEFLQR